ncbi:T-cell immunoglobulin and mucin domain-containing protein 4 [Trichomycterus rosablanca]|uniref:T-cell immunoglobulin and mucin domain-containing protein 4 n=1 Tax=Trichomycterus rosablanca TaxID=2290929 RepID=UPI002F35C42E
MLRSYSIRHSFLKAGLNKIGSLRAGGTWKPISTLSTETKIRSSRLLQKMMREVITSLPPTFRQALEEEEHFARSSDMLFRVTEGSTVILSCHYSVKQHGLSQACWGRDCGTFWCNDIVIQTDENGVISKVSDRYRLIGDVLSGQMDLGIQKIQKTDSGPYCCRVNIDGFFNDKKVTYTLKVMKAPTTTAPTTTTTTTTTLYTTEPLQNQTGSSLLDQPLETGSSVFDISWQNLTLQKSESVSEEPVSTITLQINIPVLSLLLSLLLLLMGALALLAFKRGFHIKVLDSPCLSKEPRHIAHEIRTRRPVEENIYILE